MPRFLILLLFAGGPLIAQNPVTEAPALPYYEIPPYPDSVTAS